MSLGVSIEFDKPRTLRFDLEALESLETASGGKPLGTLVGELNSLSISTLKLALWAGLKHEDKTLNPTLVRKMLQAYIDAKKPLKTLTEAVSEAILGSGLFAEPDGGTEGNVLPETTTVQ